METKESHYNRLLVAAFDFGTTYSGYAFSFSDDPLKVSTNQNWIAGSEKLISLKTPTCVLLKPNKEFHSFGFEAENMYTSLTEEDMHHGWYFFRRFKMALHERKNLTRDFQTEDIAGNAFCAIDLFSMSIRYLKDSLLGELNKRMTGIQLGDIDFVITVPAIWDDKAKHFMREAAIKAGIPTDQLKIALEPEAASIWCQLLSTEKNMPGLADIGSKYMVVDLGGGTADITVHEKKEDGTLYELHKASGGAWGGNEVDKNYVKMLTYIVGEQTMDRFKREQMGDYFDILREFETKKRSITTDKEGKLTFKVPAMLKAMFEENGKSMKDRIGETMFGDTIVWACDKIRIDMNVVKGWFQTPIQSLVSHVESILKKPELGEVGKILLVGGFGECQLVQDAFRKQFGHIQLVIPEDTELVVLKGAVRFGHMPHVIAQRVSRFSYGVEIWPEFDPSIHPADKLSVLHGHKYCKEVYREFVKIGEKLHFGRTVSKENRPASAQSTEALLSLFCSSNEITNYVTDEGCKKLGEMKVQLPDGSTREEKAIKVDYIFGDTELYVKIQILKTGNVFERFIDCI